MKLLFINCCMKPDKESRTYKIATAFIDKYTSLHPIDVTEVALKNEPIQPIGTQSLAYRLKLIEEEAWDNKVFRYARKFVEADKIIIAAPYWDLSFPALLKVYFENVFVTNLTFYYEGSRVKSLCKADQLLYITTSGGFIHDWDFGTQYVKGVADMFQIRNFDVLKAEGLDIDTMDANQIVAEALEKSKKLAEIW